METTTGTSKFQQGWRVGYAIGQRNRKFTAFVGAHLCDDLDEADQWHKGFIYGFDAGKFDRDLEDERERGEEEEA